MSPNPTEQVMQVAAGYMASSSLHIAAALNVADHLADGPKSAADLARTTGAKAGTLNRVLRLLASLGIFEQVEPGVYGLTPASQLLRSDVPGSLHGMAAFLPDPLHFKIHSNLMHSVMTGESAADKTIGMPLFDYLAKHPDYSEIFNDAMTAFSAPVAGAAVDAYDFSRYGTIVDVAGGHGEMLMTILKACPESKGVLAEIGHVAEGARPKIASAGLADRCEAVECDFFKSVPEGGDAYVMKYIIHDWDDERAELILKNIGRAMGDKGGKVILLETVVPDGPEPHLSKFIDIEMMALPGGLERTADEFAALFDRSGFELTAIVPTKSPISVVEGVRK